MEIVVFDTYLRGQKFSQGGGLAYLRFEPVFTGGVCCVGLYLFGEIGETIDLGVIWLWAKINV